jgi:fatty acid desaturase
MDPSQLPEYDFRSRRTTDPQRGPNRLIFVAILVLALALIVCSVLTNTFGWNRICGGGLVLVGGALFLLANEGGKKWPALIALAGLVLFFADWLGGLL